MPKCAICGGSNHAGVALDQRCLHDLLQAAGETAVDACTLCRNLSTCQHSLHGTDHPCRFLLDGEAAERLIKIRREARLHG